MCMIKQSVFCFVFVFVFGNSTEFFGDTTEYAFLVIQQRIVFW